MTTERKIRSSFRNVKRDIASLREQVSRLMEQQEEIAKAVFCEECECEPVVKRSSKKKRR
ncbi:Uncharacterised protein [uncultured archaeon]|nr:Uncharacterised protein [uncultured archaeon]